MEKGKKKIHLASKKQALPTLLFLTYDIFSLCFKIPKTDCVLLK